MRKSLYFITMCYEDGYSQCVGVESQHQAAELEAAMLSEPEVASVTIEYYACSVEPPEPHSKMLSEYSYAL